MMNFYYIEGEGKKGDNNSAILLLKKNENGELVWEECGEGAIKSL